MDAAAGLEPPPPAAVRELAAMFTAAGFARAEAVSPEPRAWQTWPREQLRSALLPDVPPVMASSVQARRQLRRLEHEHPAAAALFRLLTIGEPMAEACMRGVPPELLHALCAAGIASAAAERWTARFRVVPIQGLFLLADFPRLRPVLQNDFVQLGSDSAMLARMIVREGRPGHRALDLCTGGGVQALLLAQRHEHVDATDLNPRALAMARANAALNGCGAAVSLQLGDLYDGVSGRYDLITANPPYMLLPEDEAKTNFTGNGGELGIQITLRVMEGLAARLSDRGEAFIYTQGPHIGGRCVLREQTAARLAGEPLHVEFEEVVRGYWSAFRDFYRAMNVEWLTSYRVRVRRADRFTLTVRPLTGWRRAAAGGAVAIERGGWL